MDRNTVAHKTSTIRDDSSGRMFYIEIVGLDGAGKSKLTRYVKYKLGEKALAIHIPDENLFTHDVVKYTSKAEEITPLTRTLTYMAAYSEAYDRYIKPHQHDIDYIIGDRGYACFHAYQHQTPKDVTEYLWNIALHGIFPDLLVFVDTPIQKCKERIKYRTHPSKMDTQPLAFFQEVRERYLHFCKAYHKGEVLILDGTRHINIKTKITLKHIKKLKKSV